MDFRLYSYNEDFDYLNDSLPDELFEFGDQFERAREILKKRNLPEIFYGFESLDWMLREGSKLLQPITLKIATEKGHAYSSRVKALKQFSHEFDIEGQSSLPNATWAEYFALLAMAYIGESLIPCDANYPDHPSRIDYGNYSYYVESAVESMEAVCIAEFLLEQQKQPKSTTIQKIGSKGGNARAAKFSDLIESVMKLYHEKYSHRSNREAARRILDEIDGNELSVLSTSDPQKQLEKWIARYK